MLLTIQGGFAEYERAKISERTRRGRQHWAKQGAIMGGSVPYGYIRIPRDNEKRARLEIDDKQADVVRRMYDWLVNEKLSCRAIAARLQANGTPTKLDGIWHGSTVHHILKQEVYAGTYYDNKNKQVEPKDKIKCNPYKKNTKTSMQPKPKEEWIRIDVPSYY